MNEPVDDRLKLLTLVIYGLHLFSAMAGIASAAFVLITFLTGWPSLLAVLLNYLCRQQVVNTYLESHFDWQIRTFWFALLWLVLAVFLMITGILIPLAYILAVIVGIWLLYRIFRGVWRLARGLGMPESRQ